MSVFRLIVFVGFLAGGLAGFTHGVLFLFTTAPLIQQAEVYEQRESADKAPDHSASTAGDMHEHEEWQPADGFERSALTLIAATLGGIGFTLMLAAAAEFRNRPFTWREGAIWGLAGFAVFTLAPGLGLPPELPAMPSAPLAGRQIWWIATAAGTAAGLALIVYGPSILWAALGVLLIVAPHVVGAPQPADYATPIPEALHHQFMTASFATNFIFWVMAGVLTSVFRQMLSSRAVRSRALAT